MAILWLCFGLVLNFSFWFAIFENAFFMLADLIRIMLKFRWTRGTGSEWWITPITIVDRGNVFTFRKEYCAIFEQLVTIPTILIFQFYPKMKFNLVNESNEVITSTLWKLNLKDSFIFRQNDRNPQHGEQSISRRRSRGILFSQRCKIGEGINR